MFENGGLLPGPGVILAGPTYTVWLGHARAGASGGHFHGVPPGRSVLPAMSPAPEVRKTVTVIFTDVAGWTALGEDLDPESLRGVMSRYFEAMRSVIERHGGTVEKFIGDAVMAVFGVPAVREDDALRAVRTAVEMGSALDSLNEGLERDHGVRLRIRTGVHTGEVVAGPDTREILATGPAVTVAARLEQAAEPGDILIGDPTYQLVRDAVEAEPLGPLELKGRSAAVRTWRLLGVAPGARGVERHLESMMVGRDQELATLHEALDRATATGACQVVTVMAEAGVGKSRLAEEFAHRVADDATVVQGRCLPYGEGITFWPVAEAVRQLAGIDPRDDTVTATAKVARVAADDPDATGVTAHVAAAIGLTDVVHPVQETFWAVRRLLEAAARTRPLVVAFDDIHWAESTFLDLVEYLWGWTTSSPILLLCSARPELLEARPGWGRGSPNVSTVTLRPLSREDSETVMANLRPGGLDPAVRTRIVEVTDGNPLFIEEIVRMLNEEGRLAAAADDASGFQLPATITALLDARLEGIPAGERAVLQRASVMGKLFSWTAVAELSPAAEEPQVGADLQSLVRRALIRPERAEFAGQDGFAFCHVLIRDAAYRSIPKGTRADLHARFARWLASTAGAVDEYDEVVGYHLEQACRYGADLGAPEQGVADDGARHLVAAGLRALGRNDFPAACNLLSRAVRLLGDDDVFRIEVLSDLASALVETGDVDRARTVLTEAARRATALGDHRLLAHAVVQTWLLLGEADENTRPDTAQEMDHAYQVFESHGDEKGMCRALRARGEVEYLAGHIAARGRYCEQALVHAQRANDAAQQAEIFHLLCVDLNLGPTPVPDAVRQCEALLAEHADNRSIVGSAFHALAHLRGMQGEFDEALVMSDRFRSMLWDSGAAYAYWFFAEVPFSIEMLAGRPAEAITVLADANEHLTELSGEPDLMLAAMLAQALYTAGRWDEARAQAELARTCAVPTSQRQARGVLAKLLARDARPVEAEQMAREAAAFYAGSDMLIDHGFALLNLAEVLHLIGRPAEAGATASAAIELFELKGDVVSAASATARQRDWAIST
jgi:predicted ATPase/class 3 adenylate cyclase